MQSCSHCPCTAVSAAQKCACLHLGSIEDSSSFHIHFAVRVDSGVVRPCVQMVETVQKQPNLISHHLFLGLDIDGH